MPPRHHTVDVLSQRVAFVGERSSAFVKGHQELEAVRDELAGSLQPGPGRRGVRAGTCRVGGYVIPCGVFYELVIVVHFVGRHIYSCETSGCGVR